MPIYEYRCKECGEIFEALRPMGDRGRSLACPNCGRKAPVRVASTFAASTSGDTGGSAPAPGCGGGGFG